MSMTNEVSHVNKLQYPNISYNFENLSILANAMFSKNKRILFHVPPQWQESVSFYNNSGYFKTKTVSPL